MSLITLTFSLGQLFGLWVALFFLINFYDGNWRAMTFYCSIPGMFAWLLCVLKLQESARFQLLTGKKDEAFEIIQQMIQQNKSQFILTDDIKQQLVNWANMMNKIAKQQENASIASLFHKDKWFVTCLVWFNWFTLSFIYYGIDLNQEIHIQQFINFIIGDIDLVIQFFNFQLTKQIILSHLQVIQLEQQQQQLMQNIQEEKIHKFFSYSFKHYVLLLHILIILVDLCYGLTFVNSFYQ